MADIPLKSDDEMTNDLVGAVENIAQSVKAGSRDFTKSFTGLTTAIKRLQTTLVNAIKAIKIQVVAKPEKVQKPATKDKSTSTKEVVKEKETKTEVAPEKKAKTPKIEAAKTDVPKQPKAPKVVDPTVEAEKQKAKKQKQEDDDVRSQKLRDQAKIIALRLEEALKPKPVKEAKPPKEPKAAKEPKKTIDPQEKERVVKEKAREKEIQKRQEKVKPVKISSLIEGINQTGNAWSKMISGIRKSIVDTENIRKAEENKVAKTGKEGTKDFVGPPKKLFDKNERKASDAAEKEKDDESERRENADREASSAEKALRTYFRKQKEGQANEEAKAANDLVKQQEQAARNLEQANQKTQKELDGLIGAFQRLTPLFKGPLVNFGLKMIAKGIGYKQPKAMSKGGDVSYLASGGQAMKPKGTDTQPSMLTPGEFVVNKDASQDPENRKQLESINSGKNKKKTEYHSSGGSVGGVGYYAAGGPVMAAAGVAFVAVGSAINSVAKSFSIASEAVSSFAGAVQKANPALMEQVGLAMDDLQAVVGRALSPAITMLIPLIRQFADYVDYSAKKFAPAIESIIKITKELMSPLLELGATVANALMPFTKLLVLQFGGIVKIIIPIIDLLSSLFETVTLLMGSLGDSEFLFGVFNNSIEILSRAVSIVAGTIQLIIGAFVVGVAKMIEVLGTLINTISFGFAGESIEGFGEKAGKVGEKLYNKSLDNFKAVGEGKPKRFKAGEMSGDKGLQKDSSFGAAVRQASSMSIVGIGDEMRKNALMAGLGQKSQEESLNQIEKNTGELVDLFKDLKMPQNTGAGRIVGPNPHAPAVVNENMGALPGTAGTRFGAITPIN